MIAVTIGMDDVLRRRGDGTPLILASRPLPIMGNCLGSMFMHALVGRRHSRGLTPDALLAPAGVELRLSTFERLAASRCMITA